MPSLSLNCGDLEWGVKKKEEKKDIERKKEGSVNYVVGVQPRICIYGEFVYCPSPISFFRTGSDELPPPLCTSILFRFFSNQETQPVVGYYPFVFDDVRQAAAVKVEKNKNILGR